MVCDLDTVCVSLKSPEGWARSADMPDTQAHFEAVAALLKKPLPVPVVVEKRTSSLAHIDMARSASELGF
jgi:hypothetical protein